MMKLKLKEEFWVDFNKVVQTNVFSLPMVLPKSPIVDLLMTEIKCDTLNLNSLHSRLPNKHRHTLIDFWDFFLGLRSN